MVEETELLGYHGSSSLVGQGQEARDYTDRTWAELGIGSSEGVLWGMSEASFLLLVDSQMFLFVV